ncbi:hypothetical protein NDU88_005911 [Pleurodeles waltl]|uniref:Uncharacterized protein n=1 Tax=Pleurodeles waltl TaxID=8319 RepID=A0AAV7LMR8_PLEWA|nr:hypothetical protein NDU88_005911 [Pleurodeles waltl]
MAGAFSPAAQDRHPERRPAPGLRDSLGHRREAVDLPRRCPHQQSVSGPIEAGDRLHPWPSGARRLSIGARWKPGRDAGRACAAVPALEAGAGKRPPEAGKQTRRWA